MLRARRAAVPHHTMSCGVRACCLVSALRWLSQARPCIPPSQAGRHEPTRREWLGGGQCWGVLRLLRRHSRLLPLDLGEEQRGLLAVSPCLASQHDPEAGFRAQQLWHALLLWRCCTCWRTARLGSTSGGPAALTHAAASMSRPTSCSKDSWTLGDWTVRQLLGRSLHLSAAAAHTAAHIGLRSSLWWWGLRPGLP